MENFPSPEVADLLWAEYCGNVDEVTDLGSSAYQLFELNKVIYETGDHCSLLSLCLG